MLHPDQLRGLEAILADMAESGWSQAQIDDFLREEFVQSVEARVRREALEYWAWHDGVRARLHWVRGGNMGIDTRMRNHAYLPHPSFVARSDQVNMKVPVRAVVDDPVVSQIHVQQRSSTTEQSTASEQHDIYDPALEDADDSQLDSGSTWSGALLTEATPPMLA